MPQAAVSTTELVETLDSVARGLREVVDDLIALAAEVREREGTQAPA